MTTEQPSRRAHSVPAGWAHQNPVDDAPIPRLPNPPAPRSHPRPRTEAAPGTTVPHRHRRAPDDLTGKPRVDWTAYDDQAAQDYANDPVWVLYRCWTTVPVDGRWWVRAWQHLEDFLLGPQRRLLWVGISMRAMIARGVEHLADKHWRRQIHIIEVDQTITFGSKADAEAYEEERIRAECPVYNTDHNERALNPGAVHRTKRIKPHHVADWHAQAGLLALGWVALAALMTWVTLPDNPGFIGTLQAVGGGFMLAAVILQAFRIGGLFLRGNQLTTAQRQRIHAKLAARTASRPGDRHPGRRRPQ